MGAGTAQRAEGLVPEGDRRRMAATLAARGGRSPARQELFFTSISQSEEKAPRGRLVVELASSEKQERQRSENDQ